MYSLFKKLTWQMLSEDSWVFGPKVRGIVRDYYAQVYFDEEIGKMGSEHEHSPEYGWVWIAHVDRVLGLPKLDAEHLCSVYYTGVARADGDTVRGIAFNLNQAIELCEAVLKIK
jgi:hypothetical protein